MVQLIAQTLCFFLDTATIRSLFSDDHGAGVDSGRSLHLSLGQDPESI